MSKLGIFGSRSLFDESVRLEINEYLNNNSNITTIVTCQEPRGVSEVAQRVARDRILILEVHFLNPNKGRGAFHCRAVEIIKNSSQFLIIHDGESKGTAHELELVKKSEKKYSYITLSKSMHYDVNTGYNITDGWQKRSKYNDAFAAGVLEPEIWDN
ncbi:MAG: hypothetical protein LBQ68_03600 [Clostridiales bacterium]|jgi:hypothetical protein|nr:hypothetical protein [Clostridiales bacterium]